MPITPPRPLPPDTGLGVPPGSFRLGFPRPRPPPLPGRPVEIPPGPPGFLGGRPGFPGRVGLPGRAGGLPGLAGGLPGLAGGRLGRVGLPTEGRRLGATINLLLKKGAGFPAPTLLAHRCENAA